VNSFSLCLSDIIANFLSVLLLIQFLTFLCILEYLGDVQFLCCAHAATSSTHPGNLQMMNEDLLKKSNEKAVSIAARSLITLFREVRSFLASFLMFFNMLEFLIAKPLLIEVQICPSLLVKDHGRPDDPKARESIWRSHCC